MEIIHLILGKANPNRLNGVNKVVYQLATEQTKADINVSVWGITKQLEYNYPERSFTTILFQAQKNPFGIDALLKKAILLRKDAVFHLHGGWIPVYSSLAKFFAKHQIRFVLTPHGAYNTIAMQRSSLAKKWYFKWFEKQLLEKAYQIHSIGKSEVDGLQILYPNTKSILLPYGFDMPNTIYNTAKNKEFTIGFIGRLDVHTKGLDLLLEAFYHFQLKHPFSKLWIIGEGEGRAFLEKFIKEKQLSNVVLWGKKFGAEKDELTCKMHVFAHPSRNEGLPTSVLEAASFGLPSIVSEATNVAEYITKYNIGISIANNSVTELTEAMLALKSTYDNKLEGDFKSNSRSMLQEVFAWSTLVNKYNKLYE